MALAPLELVDPAGRAWTVRVVRFERPPWRAVAYGDFDDADSAIGSLFLLLATIAWGLVAVLLLPLVVYLFELPCRVLRAAFSRRRLVVATHTGPAPSRLSWRTDAVHAASVAEQVADQLELGHGRLEPHPADFLGFSRPQPGPEG